MRGRDVHTLEGAATHLPTEALDDGVLEALGVLAKAYAQLLSPASDAWLECEPVPLLIAVEISCALGKPHERVLVGGGLLAGSEHPEVDALSINTVVLGVEQRCRREEDRAHKLARGAHRPQARGILGIEPHRERALVRGVHLLVEDGIPGVLEIPQELGAHGDLVERDAVREDEWRAILAVPERCDHERHEPQHTTGALEPLQRRPGLVEDVEELGVDRVGPAQPLGVGTVARVTRHPATGSS
jgi:hypothetical protein